MHKKFLLKASSALAGLGRYFSMNEVLNLKNDVEYPPEVTVGTPEDLQGSVTIHSYRPRVPIINWFEFANFERRITAEYIAEGRACALQHDCAAEGCLVAS